MPEREAEDPEFSAPPVPTPPSAAEKPKKPKREKAEKPASNPDTEDESKPTAPEAENKPNPGERGHPLVGDAEPIAPTPTMGSEQLEDISVAQRAKKREIRLKKALKEFPEIKDIIDENEALKALVAELNK